MTTTPPGDAGSKSDVPKHGADPEATGEASLRELTLSELVRLGLDPQPGADPSVLFFEVAGEAADWTCYVWCREEASQVLVHSVMSSPVPGPARERVAIYLTRANFGLLIGNFEFDLNDGELRYKTSLDFSDAAFDQRLLRVMVSGNLRAMERYLPGVVAVIDGAAPLAAVEAIERSAGDEHDEDEIDDH